MIPYHRFLVTVMALPVSQEHRYSLLEEHHCYGLTLDQLNFFTEDLANQEGIPEKLREFWKHIRNGVVTDYNKDAGYQFALSQNVIELYTLFQFNKLDQGIQQAVEIASRQSYAFTVLPLFLTDLHPEKIAELLNAKYSKSYDVESLYRFHYYFARFDSMSSLSLKKWINSVPDRLRYLLRLAMNEPIYILLDELGINTDLDLKAVSSKIMSRSLRHFEQLSRVNHHIAMREAREWGKVALAAGKDFEKSKKGNISDFLAEFQVSLLEAEDSLIEHDDDISSDFEKGED